MTDNPLYGSILEAARLAGCCRSTIYSLMGEGRIRAVKLGRRTLVDLRSVRAYLDTLPPARIAPHVGRPTKQASGEAST